VPHLNKSLARSNKNPFNQGFLTVIATINLREFIKSGKIKGKIEGTKISNSLQLKAFSCKEFQSLRLIIISNNILYNYIIVFTFTDLSDMSLFYLPTTENILKTL